MTAGAVTIGFVEISVGEWVMLLIVVISSACFSVWISLTAQRFSARDALFRTPPPHLSAAPWPWNVSLALIVLLLFTLLGIYAVLAIPGLEKWLENKGLYVDDSFIVDKKCGTVTVQQQGFFSLC